MAKLKRPSPRGKLNAEDASKVFAGAVIAGIGAAAMHAIGYLSGIDFGPFAAEAAAVLSVMANLVRKWLGGPK